MMVLRNYIELPMGVPTRLHFVSGQISQRTITDPVTGQPKAINVLLLATDRVNGEPVSAFLSVTSEKLAGQLMPHVTGGKLADRQFTITANGQGFARTYTVDVG